MANRLSQEVVSRYLAGRGIRLDRNVIRSLAQNIEAYLARKTPPSPWGNRILLNGLPFEIRAVDGTYLTVYIQVRSVETGNPYYIVGGGQGRYRSSGRTAVVIYVNGRIDVKKAAAGKGIQNQLYPILLHELTHAADKFTKGVGDQMTEEEARGNAAYYNNPGEVRAYLQEILHELRDSYRHIENLRKVIYPNTGEALKVLLNQSKTWQDIEPHLTDRNKKLIMKAVAQEYQDYLDEQSVR